MEDGAKPEKTEPRADWGGGGGSRHHLTLNRANPKARLSINEPINSFFTFRQFNLGVLFAYFPRSRPQDKE